MATKQPQPPAEGSNVVVPPTKKKLWYGIAGTLFLCSVAGGFVAYRSFKAPPVSMAAKAKTKAEPLAEPKEQKNQDDEPASNPENKVTEPNAPSEKTDTKADTKAIQGETPKKNADQKVSQFGEFIELPKMEFNVGNPLENRILRISMTLELREGSTQKEELTRRISQVKDIIMTAVSAKTKAEILSEKGKERLRLDMVRRINEVFDRPIKNVFFSEYLVE